MGYFNLHFFKEKTRTIDFEAVVDFFETFGEIETKIDDSSVRFYYTHPRLGYQAVFYITPKSQVPNIQDLNPKYLEINFHLKIAILTPDYAVKQIIELAKKVAERFSLFVYSEFFNDVLPFKSDTIFKAYSLVKDAFAKKYPEKLSKYILVNSEKLSAVLRYLDEREELQYYYKDLGVVVPKYFLLKNSENQAIFTIELQEGTASVFPPQINYILYRSNGNIKVISYQQFISECSKYLMDVPGFLRGTKVLMPKYQKKVHRILKKGKFSPIEEQFTKLELDELMD